MSFARIAKRAGVSTPVAKAVFMALLMELRRNRTITLRGFGRFFLHEYDERKIWNWRLKQMDVIPPTTVVRFKTANVLRRRLSGFRMRHPPKDEFGHIANKFREKELNERKTRKGSKKGR